MTATAVPSSAIAAPDAPRRSNAILAACSGPCLPVAAFGVALSVTLPEFYATHVGIEMGMVAAVFMAVRLIDILFDPFIGWGMDKTRTRLGRYRPWMAVATPILMLAALMMFVTVQPGAGPVYLFAWLLVLYLGFSMGTLGQLGWAAVLAPQYDQRSRVYGWWQVFNIIGVILILILPTIVVKTGIGDYADGVRIMGWAIIIALPLTIGLAMVAVPEPVNAGAAPHGGPSAYLALLKMRMEERLTVDLQIPDGLRSAAFPPMMLQSMVENAIKHGLECKPEGGTLRIVAEVADSKLRVTVTDDGVGFGVVPSDGTGLGLQTIRDRLKLLHGDSARLHIGANSPSGVIATIEVPYQLSKQT